MDDLCRGFADLSDLMKGEHVDIDAGTLLYVCAWRHKQACMRMAIIFHLLQHFRHS